MSETYPKSLRGKTLETDRAKKKGRYKRLSLFFTPESDLGAFDSVAHIYKRWSEIFRVRLSDELSETLLGQGSTVNKVT